MGKRSIFLLTITFLGFLLVTCTSSLAQAPPFDKVKELALIKGPADQSGNYLWIIKAKNGQKIEYGKDLIYEQEVMYGLGWFKSLNIISV